MTWLDMLLLLLSQGKNYGCVKVTKAFHPSLMWQFDYHTWDSGQWEATNQYIKTAAVRMRIEAANFQFLATEK